MMNTPGSDNALLSGWLVPGAPTQVGVALGAQVVANGLPMTRGYVQAQLRSAQPVIHFTETSQQVRAKQTHLYTPVAMNRQPQDSADIQPRYNFTAGFRARTNLAPHLDFGTLSMLGNHMVRVGTMSCSACVSPQVGVCGLFDAALLQVDGPTDPNLNLSKNVYASMLPITVTDLGAGYVVGTERIITRRSGTYSFGTTCPDSRMDFTEQMVAAAAGCTHATCSGSSATVEIFDNNAVFVRQWTVPDVSRPFSILLAAGQMAVASCDAPASR